MIRIWIYKVLIAYYSYCFHSWVDTYCNNRDDQAKKWAMHYRDKLWKTKKRLDAYRYYISLRRL